jgi:NADH-quinone oxidoreductase subunit M
MLWAQGDYSLSQSSGWLTTRWQLEERYTWIPHLGVSIHLAIDGLSLMMVLLTGLLGIMAIGCSWSEIQRHVGFFHLNLLWSLGGVIGVFLALDMFLFSSFGR